MARHVVIFITVMVCLSPSLEAASTEIRPALAAFIEGRYSDAEDSLKTMLAHRGTERAQIRYLLGRINTWEGDLEAAFDWFEKAVKAESDTADYQYWLGMLYGARAQRASVFGKPGKARRARKAFEMAVRLDPDHVPARIKLLEYHLHAPGILGGSKEKALKQASEIASRNTMEGHMAWALIHAKEKAQDKREKAYLDAVALANGDVRPVISLATLYLRDDRRLDAIRVYETYLQSYPDRSTILRRLSNQYRLEKKNDKAYQAARRSLEVATEALVTLAADPAPIVRTFENALTGGRSAPGALRDWQVLCPDRDGSGTRTGSTDDLSPPTAGAMEVCTHKRTLPARTHLRAPGRTGPRARRVQERPETG